ncbi:PD40 domain-containing protein [Candidatus Dependentiae bacterium]|nr:PD40 domain-containing protein [Candidatus Dependentiae bacterium]
MKRALLILSFLILISLSAFSVTLTDITIDGDFSDWAAVLQDPHNYVTDPSIDHGDLDEPYIVQAGRDFIIHGFTWNDTYLFFYMEMNTIASSKITILYYVDLEFDDIMQSTDEVLVFAINNQSVTTSKYNYVPNIPAGDPIPHPGDGQIMPGTVTNKITYTWLFAKNTDADKIEMAIFWSDFGLSPGSPLMIHVSTSRGTNLGPNRGSSQVEDNVNTVFVIDLGVYIEPDRTGTAIPGGTVIYDHLITNTGNNTDTFNISNSGTNPGWTVGFFSDSGCTIPLTDTNSPVDGIVDTGPLGESVTIPIYVQITVPGSETTGTWDNTTVTGASSYNSNVNDSVLDKTLVGDIAIYPDRTGSISPNDYIIYQFTIINNDTLDHIFNITTSGTIVTWTLGLFSDFACTAPLTDSVSDTDTIIDSGNILSGSSFDFFMKLTVPLAETLGTIDSTIIRIEASDSPILDDEAIASTEVKEKIIIIPDTTIYMSMDSYKFIDHIIQNNSSSSETVNFTVSNLPANWGVKFYEPDYVTELIDNDGDTNVDITNVPVFGGESYISARIYVSTGVVEGTTQPIYITAFTTTASDTVTDTIVVRTLATYDSGAYNRVEYDFAIGDTIYAKASNLSAGSVYFEWYDNNGTLVYTSVTYTVEANNAKDQYTPVIGNQIGEWIVKLLDGSSDAELNRVYINVGDIVDSGDKLKLFPSWSPEDNRVAYVSETAAFSDIWHIYNIDLTTLTETKLTDPSDVASLVGINTAPTIIHYSKIDWDPDSAPGSGRIAFAAIDNDDGYDNSEIYIVNLTQDATGYPITKVSPAGKEGEILQGYGGWVDPAWDNTSFYGAEPDGRWMAVAERGNIWVFKPDSLADGPPSLGGSYKKLIRITNLSLTTEVDGLFNSVWFVNGGDLQLAVVYKTAGSSKSDIFIIPNVDDIISETLASPNYNSIFFDYITDIPAQYQVNDIGDLIKVTNTSNPSWAPTVSPDGTKISYSQDSNNIFDNDNFYNSPYAALLNTDFDVFKVATSTEPAVEEMFSHPFDEGFGDWSNNGQYLIHFEQPTDDEIAVGNQHTFRIEKYYIVSSTVFGTYGGGFRKSTVSSIILEDLAYSSIEMSIDALDYPTLISISEPYGAKHHINSQSYGSEYSFPVIGKKQGDLIYTGVARQIDPLNMKLNSKATISIHYTDAELKNAGIKPYMERLLVIAYFNKNTKRWVSLKSKCNPETNIITATHQKLGMFAIFLKAPPADLSLKNMKIYPNPFKISEGSNLFITFDNLPAGINTFKIFNIAGDLVYEEKEKIDTPSIMFPGYLKHTWNLKNNAGKRAASGIYIVVIKTEAGDEIVKKIGVVF